MAFRQFNGTFADLLKGDAYTFGHSEGLEPSVTYVKEGKPSFGVLICGEDVYFSNLDGPELVEEYAARARARGDRPDHDINLATEICILRFEETHQ